MGMRNSLLVSQRAARDREAELYSGVTDSPPLDGDRWRLQDHLAHLAAWRRYTAEVLGTAPASWTDLIAAIEARTEEELHATRPGFPDRELWSIVPGNGHLHLAEHLAFIAEDRGDPAGADAAQVWARDLVAATFD